MGRLFVVSGSSGVGKGTLLKEFLAKHPEFKLSVSCTTRKPRDRQTAVYEGTDGERHSFIYLYLARGY